MGAAYLCAEAGISTAVIENQAAYVAGWLKKLRDDPKLLIHAAAQGTARRGLYPPCPAYGLESRRRPRNARAPHPVLGKRLRNSTRISLERGSTLTPNVPCRPSNRDVCEAWKRSDPSRLR